MTSSMIYMPPIYLFIHRIYSLEVQYRLLCIALLFSPGPGGGPSSFFSVALLQLTLFLYTTTTRIRHTYFVFVSVISLLKWLLCVGRVRGHEDRQTTGRQQADNKRPAEIIIVQIRDTHPHTTKHSLSFLPSSFHSIIER